MELNAKASVLASGLICGVGLSFLTGGIIAFGGTTGGPAPVEHLCRGFNLSSAGSVIGLVWALVNGAIGGIILAWFYNTVAESTHKSRA